MAKVPSTGYLAGNPFAALAEKTPAPKNPPSYASVAKSKREKPSVSQPVASKWTVLSPPAKKAT
jgi:hypothetical protein